MARLLPGLTVLTLCHTVEAQGPPRLVREEHPPVLLSGTASMQSTWLDDTTLAVADVDEQRVMLVDPGTGRVRAAAGRPGEGPGEYRGVTAPIPGSDGSLLVVDTRLRRATILSRGLQVQRTVGFPVVINTVLRWTGTALYCTWYDFTRQMTPVLGLLRVTEADRALAEPLVRLDSLFGATHREPLALPPIVAAAAGTRAHTYLGKVNEYRILELDAKGRVITTFARPDLPVVRFSAQEIETETAKVRGATRTPVPAAAAARVKDVLAGMAKPFFAMSGLSEDPEGRLWVVTARADLHATEVDVFSPTGRFLGTVKLRGLVRSLAWNRHRVAAVVERDGGEEQLGAVDFYRMP